MIMIIVINRKGKYHGNEDIEKNESGIVRKNVFEMITFGSNNSGRNVILSPSLLLSLSRSPFAKMHK